MAAMAMAILWLCSERCDGTRTHAPEAHTKETLLNHSVLSCRVVRKQHLAWSPPSRPDTILLLGGNYNPDYDISPTGEEVPGQSRRLKDAFK